MASSITRSALYSRVWQTPISKLAPEFGLSDNGLRKLCRRHDIPVPPRGYWARSTAGQSVTPTPLPKHDIDPDVLTTAAKGEPKRSRERASPPRARRSAPLATEPNVPGAELRPTLRGCDPLVKNTERFFANAASRIAEHKAEAAKPQPPGQPRLADIPIFTGLNGRLAPTEPGCLRIVATLRNIGWILRFHDALIRALAAHGCSVRQATAGTTVGVEVHGSGESVRLSFAEDFDERPLNDPRRPWQTKRYIAKDTYKVKIARTAGSPKVWAGSQSQLVAQLPALAADIARLLASQGDLRKRREEEAAARRAEEERQADARRVWFAEQTLIGERRRARAEQLVRANEAGRAFVNYLATQQLLAELSSRAAPDDAAVLTWLDLVQAQLIDPIDQLMKALRAESDAEVKPLWWSEELGKTARPD